MSAQEKAEAKIQKVLAKMASEKVDQLAPTEGEFKQVAEAVMAWYQLLMASGIIQDTPKSKEVLAASLLVLGTLVKYAYALGVRRGRRMGSQRTRRSKSKTVAARRSGEGA